MLFKRLPVLALSSLMALSLSACDTDGGNPGEELTPEGDSTQYVMSSLDLPEDANEALELGFDLDNNGMVDNQLGRLLSALGSFVDAQAAVDEQVDTAGFVILVNVQAKSLDTSDRVGVSVFLGDNTNVVACSDPDDVVCRLHLDGQTEFAIDANSPRDALIVGDLTSGRFKEAAPGTVNLQISLDAESAPVDLALVGARLEISSVSENGLMSGKLGGAIPEATLQTDVLPAVAGLVNDLITTECPDAVPGNCCPAGSTGATLLGQFDTNLDCVIDVAEIAEDEIIRTVLASDVDLDGDGEEEALSLGIKFEAVSAIFDPGI